MKDLASQSDQQILALLGKRLRRTRLRQDLTQEQLAERASLSVSTIKGLESGKGRLDSLVAVLRELKQLESLNQFIPEPSVSPLQLARRQGKTRKRASGNRKDTASLSRGGSSTEESSGAQNKPSNPRSPGSHSPDPKAKANKQREDDEYSW